jgi:hypothetical protein
MEENLAGYLLGALDPETERQVEQYLANHPHARPRLEQLRRTLERLNADRESVDPPPDLRFATLARIAEYRCRTLPQAPAPTRSQRAGGRPSWRAVNSVVAACLFLVLSGLGAHWVYQQWMAQDQVSCQNNLERWYMALTSYADQNGGALPKIEAQPPKNHAGLVTVMVPDTGFSVTCSANEKRGPSRLSLQEIVDLEAVKPEEYQNLIRELSGCYAYTLGYEEWFDGKPKLIGLRLDSGADTPIMADRPPLEDVGIFAPNSPNHGGRGQNVLFVGGQVRFLKEPKVNGDDDIYHNRDNLIGAGKDRLDVVLGASNSCPYSPNDQ